MFAVLFTSDGRGGKFHNHMGDTLVAQNHREIAYLQNIADMDGGQLVDLGDSWPFTTVCVHEIEPSTQVPAQGWHFNLVA